MGWGPPVSWAMDSGLMGCCEVSEMLHMDSCASFCFVYSHCWSSLHFRSPTCHRKLLTGRLPDAATHNSVLGDPSKSTISCRAPPVPHHPVMLSCVSASGLPLLPPNLGQVSPGTALKVSSMALDYTLIPEFCSQDLLPSLVSSGSAVTRPTPLTSGGNPCWDCSPYLDIHGLRARTAKAPSVGSG